MAYFEHLAKPDFEKYCDLMFDIIYSNMNKIAPTGDTRGEDYQRWHSAVGEGFKKENRYIILIFEDGTKNIIGYFQYYINNGLFMMEEIQIIPVYQRKDNIFRKLYGFIIENLPHDTKFAEAFAHKQNSKSRGILKKLGLKETGISENGRMVHFRGEYADLLRWYNSK